MLVYTYAADLHFFKEIMPQSFRNWVERRKLREFNDPADRFRFNRDPDVAGDHEGELRELTKILISRYHDDFIQFLEKIASERGDQEIRSIVRNIQNGSSPDVWKPRHPEEQEEVVPSIADRGANVGAEM